MNFIIVIMLYIPWLHGMNSLDMFILHDLGVISQLQSIGPIAKLISDSYYSSKVANKSGFKQIFLSLVPYLHFPGCPFWDS